MPYYRQWSCRVHCSYLCIKSQYQSGFIRRNTTSGQLTTTTEIDNFRYPKGVDGQQMMEDLQSRLSLRSNRCPFRQCNKGRSLKRPFRLTIEDEKRRGGDLIIATGATARYLGLESGGEIQSWEYQQCNMRRILLQRQSCSGCRRR